jgi:hypothetical protein
MRVARPLTAVGALALALAVPAAAGAADYPAPSNPGGGPKNPPKGGTLKVCKQGKKKNCFKTIQAAVDAAGKGTTIRVAAGTYKEGVKIQSPVKDGIKLIGDPKNPDKVVLEGKGAKSNQNGVQVNNADKVTIDGFYARDYKGNGFFVVNVDGYKMTHLKAGLVGTYGLYAFNSKGGEMSSSEAFYNNDSGFYVGQTPVQTKPKRTTLKNLVSWGNVLGYSGTNSRYVTITKSKFFNNGLGIVPNVLDSEKYPPFEDNVITDNDVFWNNYDYFQGAPFKLQQSAVAADNLLYPVGTGILLFGGRRNQVENNRVWGNYLLGFGEINQIVLEGSSDPVLADAAILRDNVVTANDFGLAGADLNGRDMFYGGDGSGNCFAGNTLRSPTVPADGSTFVACGQTNVQNDSARNEGIGWSGDSSHEANWVRNPHMAIEGITPLEHWTADYPNPVVK